MIAINIKIYSCSFQTLINNRLSSEQMPMVLKTLPFHLYNNAKESKQLSME